MEQHWRRIGAVLELKPELHHVTCHQVITFFFLVPVPGVMVVELSSVSPAIADGMKRLVSKQCVEVHKEEFQVLSGIVSLRDAKK